MRACTHWAFPVIITQNKGYSSNRSNFRQNSEKPFGLLNDSISEIRPIREFMIYLFIYFTQKQNNVSLLNYRSCTKNPFNPVSSAYWNYKSTPSSYGGKMLEAIRLAFSYLNIKQILFSFQLREKPKNEVLTARSTSLLLKRGSTSCSTTSPPKLWMQISS